MRRIGLRFFFRKEIVVVVDDIVRLPVYMPAALVLLHELHPSAGIDFQNMSLIIFGLTIQVLFQLASSSF